MNCIEKLEERRCGKCPAHYGGFNGEDYDDGCCINHDYGTKMCMFAFLPHFVIKAIMRIKEYREWKCWERELED